MAPKKKNTDPSGSASEKPRVGTHQSQGSKPQDTQPVEKFQDVGDPAMPECPIKGCEWKICDVSCDEGANEVSSLLKKKNLHGDMSLDQDGSNKFEYEYECFKDYLEWLLCPPGFHKDWHIGVEDKSKKQLVAFIAAVPRNMRLHGKDMQMAEVKFLCVLDEPGSDEELEPLLLKEMARRVYPHGVQSVVFASRDHFSDELITTCQNWSRILNIKKLFNLKFIKLGEGMDVKTAEEEYNSLLTSPATTHGLRKMEAKDIPSVTSLLQTYLGRFDLTPMFNEREVQHWFLPRADIVDSYVVESENKDITHFISFSTLSFSISIVDVYDSTSTIKSTRSLYNVSTEAQPPELLKMALVLAKSNDSDIFDVLNIMDNNDRVLEDLMFGSPVQRNFYRLRKELEPREVGPMFF